MLVVIWIPVQPTTTPHQNDAPEHHCLVVANQVISTLAVGTRNCFAWNHKGHVGKQKGSPLLRCVPHLIFHGAFPQSSMGDVGPSTSQVPCQNSVRLAVLRSAVPNV